MNDNSNNSQNTEYAGPPKAHSFQNNTVEAPKPKKVIAPTPEPKPAPQPEPEPLQRPKDNELLDLISEPDRIKSSAPVKKSFEFNFDFKAIASYKKKIREYLKENESSLRTLNLIWVVLKSCFYFVGLSFFVICLGFYVSFEALVNSYLSKHDLGNISYGRVERSLSEVVFSNVQDKTGLFKINKIKISFSFADLLEKKIQLVEIDSLRIYLKDKQNTSGNFKELARMLWKFGVLDNRSLFSIQSVRLENSVLYVDNKEYKLPVNFSGVGSLAEKKQITFPVNFESRYLSMNATLLADISATGASWTLDILSGSLTLPGMDPEVLTGKFSIKTSHGQVLSSNFAGTLTRDGLDKLIEIEVLPAQRGLFNVKINTIIKNEASVIYALNLANVKIDKSLSSFSTSDPLFLKISNMKTSKFNSDAIQLTATGDLKCDPSGCSYRLTKNGDFIVFTPKYSFYDTQFSVLYPLRLSFEPTKGDTFTLKNKKLTFDIEAGRADFEVRKQLERDTQINSVISLSSFTLIGKYDLTEEKWSGNLTAGIREFTDTSASLTKGKLEVAFDGASYKGSLISEKAQLLQNPYFKLPAHLKATFNSDYYFTANLDTPNNWVSLSTNGYYHPYTGEVLMAVQTNKPVVFAKGTPEPSDITSLLSSKIKNTTGSISLKGEVHYTTARSIAGPLQVLIDNLSFDFGNMRIEGVNTLLNLTQLVPFGGQGAQDVYVRSIRTSLPFENITAQIFFDAARKQFNISSMDASLAGYSLRVDPMWYTYDSPVYNISLKGKNVALQPLLNRTTLKDLKISAKGSISLTTQVEDDHFTLKNAELSIPSEGRIQYTPKKYANSYLENLKQLDFRRLSVYLNEQNDKFELVFSTDNKSGKVKKKTSFRLNLKDTLSKYVLPAAAEPLPAAFIQAKESF